MFSANGSAGAPPAAISTRVAAVIAVPAFRAALPKAAFTLLSGIGA
jgi:hypothetical protein